MTALRQRMTEDMQVRNLSLNTQKSYLQQVTRFAREICVKVGDGDLRRGGVSWR